MGGKSPSGSHAVHCSLAVQTEPSNSHHQGPVGRYMKLGATFMTVKSAGKVSGLQVLGTLQERGFEVVVMTRWLNEPHRLPHK